MVKILKNGYQVLYTTARFMTGEFKSFMDANHCFCLTLLPGNLWKLSPLPCLFFTANCCTWFYHFLVWYTFLCNLCRELLWGALLFMIHCPEVARGQDVISATQWVTADSTWKTWPQPVAARVLGRMMALCKNLPSWDHWEKKKGSILFLKCISFI